MFKLLRSICLILVLACKTTSTTEIQTESAFCHIDKILGENSEVYVGYSYNEIGKLAKIQYPDTYFLFEYHEDRLTKLKHVNYLQVMDFYVEFQYLNSTLINARSYYKNSNSEDYILGGNIIYTYNENSELISMALNDDSDPQITYHLITFEYLNGNPVLSRTYNRSPETDELELIVKVEIEYDDMKSAIPYDFNFQYPFLNQVNNVIKIRSYEYPDSNSVISDISYTYLYNENRYPISRTIVSSQTTSIYTYVCD